MRITSRTIDDNKVLEILGKRDSDKSRHKSNTNKEAYLVHNGDIFLDKLEVTPVYSKNNTKYGKCGLTELDIINFHNEIIGIDCDFTNYSVFIGEKEYLYKDFPKIDDDWCKEIKAEGNIINIEKDNYYKYKDANGKSHIFAATSSDFSQPLSDRLAGRYDEKTHIIANFWKYLAIDGSVGYGWGNINFEDCRRFVYDAGIQSKSFFKVKLENYENEMYFSNTKNTSPVVEKKQYDADYKNNSELMGRHFPPGTVLKYGGNEYVVNEDHTIDIPYGEDIYDFDFPPINPNYDWKTNANRNV